jgi:hypothetical protein
MIRLHGICSTAATKYNEVQARGSAPATMSCPTWRLAALLQDRCRAINPEKILLLDAAKNGGNAENFYPARDGDFAESNEGFSGPTK